MTTSSVEFNFEFRGRTYQCFYAIEDQGTGSIRVSTPWGPRSGTIGDAASPLLVARLLAGEVARDSRRLH
jgi:hypothetical protein